MRFLPTIAGVFILTSTMLAADKKIFIELRAPKAVEFSHASVEFVGEHTSAGTPLMKTRHTADGSTNVFSTSFVIYTSLYKERRFAVIVSPDASPQSMAQVFQLPISQNPKPTHWTEWHRPSYIENSKDVSNNFMDNLSSPDRSTNMPPNCFEMRYKIEAK
jgi:hypothetical protein